MKLFIVNCINVITCDGDSDFNDEQLGVFSTRELAEQFITTLPKIIGNNYWNNDLEHVYDPFAMQLARYEIKELIVTDSGKMPWGMLSSEEEDRILAHKMDNDQWTDGEDDRDSCHRCGSYHSMSGPCDQGIDDDLPF